MATDDELLNEHQWKRLRELAMTCPYVAAWLHHHDVDCCSTSDMLLNMVESLSIENGAKTARLAQRLTAPYSILFPDEKPPEDKPE